MKTIITSFFFFITTVSFCQISDKWEHLISVESKNRDEKYFFTSIQNAYDNKYKIVKKLDTTYCIIENSSIKGTNFLKEVRRVNNLWKLPSNFLQHKESKLYVVTTENSALLVKHLNAMQITIAQIINDRLVVIKSDSKTIVNDIISLNNVSSISHEALTPQGEAKIIDQNFSINRINKANSNFPELMGENQIVSIKDDFFDVNDIDLLNKHIPSTTQSSLISNHANAMATIVSGLGNSSALGKGVAQKAKLQSSDFLNLYPDDVLTLQGATTQNHSYGTIIENFYGTLAATYDAQLFDNPFLTHCFSSGNKGFEGYQSLTGNFKQSKNSIVIGCIDQNEVIMPFSSKGPAYDGRIKPELVAYSTQGTSNASALTTGIVSLMQEHFKNINNIPLLNASTKAVLINSAKDLGTTGPDFTYGYGSIDANKCLKTISESRIILGTSTGSQTNLHEISIPVNAKNLKITLVWNDVPATVNSAISLVNDLDLEVISANNTVFLPWILDPNLPTQPAVTGKDKFNTIEQVLIANPVLGFYNIAVIGTSTSNNSQDYSIAYDYEMQDQFEWSYPILNDNFPYDGKTISPFKWDTTFLSDSGQLSISYDNGQTWEIIANGINLENEQFTYIPSEQIFSKARLKMKVDTVEYISDSFTISYDLNISTSLVCDGVTEIKWNMPSGVSLFTIYELTGDRLQFKEQTANATYVYTNGKNHTVAPVLDNHEGIKSESTFQYEPNSNCYYELTLAEVFEDNKVKIIVSLFSLYNIKRVELIKIINNTQSTISTITDVNLTSFYFLDLNPNKGKNEYMVKIVLENDRVINSEILNATYLGNSMFLVYPSLLSNNQELIIESKKEEEAIFYMYNLNGQNVVTAPILSKISSISLKNSAAGVYIYKIVAPNGETETGKIVIL